MIPAVKNFVEYNIDLIEKQDWEELFKNWYIYNNDYYFEDVMDVLEVVEPDVWKLSWEARAKILREIAVNVFTNKSLRSKRITLEYIVDELSSLFGFEGQDLLDILNQAAKQVGLHQATNGWYVL